MIDFLSITPPRVANTWLRQNLNDHPEIVAYGEYYEYCEKRLGIYRSLSRTKRVMGDISPRLGVLTTKQIKAICDHCPGLKLIFLIRDPIDRAISHLNHMDLYKEGYFKDRQQHEVNLLDAMCHTYSIMCGDYPSIYKRWNKFVNKNRIYVRLFEQVVAEPGKHLNEMCDFLGVSHFDFPNCGEIVKNRPEEVKYCIDDVYLKELWYEMAEKTRELFPHLPFDMWKIFKKDKFSTIWNYTEGDLLYQQTYLSGEPPDEPSHSMIKLL